MKLSTRLFLESLAFAMVFAQHEHNSATRKWTTIIFFVTWSVLTVLLFVESAVELWVYMPITAVVFYIIGRQHEAEFQKLLNLR